jgi:hypothetical protein
MNAPGPVSPMMTPDPTNKPAPMTPPSAIMFNCRCESPPRSGAAPLVSWVGTITGR